MKYEKIRAIWSEYVNSEEYNKGDFSFTISAEETERLEEMFGKEKCRYIENVAMNLACNAEMLGFIQGFRVAMQLMKECL